MHTSNHASHTSDGDGPFYVVVPTHTPRHLLPTLVALGAQDTPPTGVVISCDNDGADILDVVRQASERIDDPLTILQRAKGEVGRLSQVRNNAIRHLRSRGVPGEARLLFMDGDCVLARDGVAWHHRLGRGAEMVSAYRINLTPEQTDALSLDDLRAGRTPTPTDANRAELARRHRRYTRQALLRRFKLAKANKPKILGGHHSVTMDLYLRLNGHDETYFGWGMEDDDFCRRAHRSGARVAIGVNQIMAFHLYHEHRSAGGWHDAQNADKYKAEGRQGLIRCERGVDNGVEQADVVVTEFGV